MEQRVVPLMVVGFLLVFAVLWLTYLRPELARRRAGAPRRKAEARDWAVMVVLFAMLAALALARLRLSPLTPTTVWLLSGNDGAPSLSCRTLRGTMILESDAGRVRLDGVRLRVELPAVAGRGPATVVLGRRAEVRVVGQLSIGGRTFRDGDRFTATADNVLVRESPTRATLRSLKRRIELLLRRRQPIEGMIRCSTFRPRDPNAPVRELGEFVFRERQAAGSKDSFSADAWRTVTGTMTTTALWTRVAASPLPAVVGARAPLERFIGTPLTAMTPERAGLIDAIRLMETRADASGSPTDALARLDRASLEEAACRACRDMLCRTATDGSRCIETPSAGR